MQIETKELDRFIGRVQATEKDLSQVGEVMVEAAKFILDKAKGKMPRKSGGMQGSFTVKKKGQAAALITSGKHPYAGVQEFGGPVIWRSKGGYVRVPVHGEFRMMRMARIPVKAPKATGYHIYPAIDDNQSGIQRVVGNAISKKVIKKLG